MQLSAFSVLDEYEGPIGAGRDRLRETVELAEVADGAGLRALWVAEHHFHRGGVCPSPPVLLAAAAARTQRLRLGAMVSVLPFHDPVRLAEQYAMVDRLSGGRLDLGVGSGYIAEEFDGFGTDPATKRARFEENLDRLLAAFRGEPVRRPPESLGTHRLNVAPVQRPHPPIWVAVQRREAVPFVARQGRSIALIPYATVDNVDELAGEIAEFKAALPSNASASVSVGLHLYAGPNLEVARGCFQRYLDSRLASGSAFFQQKVAADPRARSGRAIEEAGFALFGSAEEVLEGLTRFEKVGVDEVLGIFDFGGLPTAEVHRSVRSLGRVRAAGVTG